MDVIPNKGAIQLRESEEGKETREGRRKRWSQARGESALFLPGISPTCPAGEG